MPWMSWIKPFPPASRQEYQSRLQLSLSLMPNDINNLMKLFGPLKQSPYLSSSQDQQQENQLLLKYRGKSHVSLTLDCTHRSSKYLQKLFMPTAQQGLLSQAQEQLIQTVGKLKKEGKDDYQVLICLVQKVTQMMRESPKDFNTNRVIDRLIKHSDYKTLLRSLKNQICVLVAQHKLALPDYQHKDQERLVEQRTAKNNYLLKEPIQKTCIPQRIARLENQNYQKSIKQITILAKKKQQQIQFKQASNRALIQSQLELRARHLRAKQDQIAKETNIFRAQLQRQIKDMKQTKRQRKQERKKQNATIKEQLLREQLITERKRQEIRQSQLKSLESELKKQYICKLRH